ncbi:MAG: CDP-diacylglycerol--glycerol-3-phosphate 3-phosphatidyltransferase [Planctomycetota bacterium]|jgi:CDP-diacylglycerol--glycerol-3-phosphate 3-phosphatidyltransferase
MGKLQRIPPLTPPNVITVARLASIPFIVWLSYSPSAAGRGAAAGLFLLAVISDCLDGYLARRTGTTSRLGTLLDPLVDKTMILCALFVFADLGLLPLWLVLLNMFRELLVTALRHGMASRGKVVGANWMGKTKFVLQTGVVLLCYLYLLLEATGSRLPGQTATLFWCTLGMTIISFAFLANFARMYRSDILPSEEEPSPD